MLAAAAGCEVGPVVTIVEGGGGGAVPVLKGGAARMAMAAPIEAGSETLSLQVTVTYELDRWLTRPHPSVQNRPDRAGRAGQNVAAKRSAGPAVTAGSRPAACGQDLGGEEAGGDELLVEELVARTRRRRRPAAPRRRARPGSAPTRR